MSSNPADPPPSAAAPTRPRGSWSMTVRLAVLSAVSSFVILALVSIQMYFQLANHLKEQNYRYLKDETETLGAMAVFPEFEEMVATEMHIEHAGEEYLTHYVRLLDTKGAKSGFIETPGMGNILPPGLFPLPGKDVKAGTMVAVRNPGGASFIVTALLLDTGHVRQQILQVGLDVTNVETILAGYRSRLALTLVAGFLLCALTGLAVARRGTRPIRQIMEKARQITVTNLNERLGDANWPRELNNLAGALNGMLDRLEDSFGRMYHSVANLTHKLRTPLTILQGEAEIALGRERSAEELREVVESSLEECGRLSRLVDNIIFVAQAETGKLQPVPIKISAGTEIDKVLDFYDPLAEEKGIAVTREGNATLMADPAMFRKALTHLLTNALTFTPGGETVVISVRQGDDRYVELAVTDTGCGIAEQEMPQIFDRFYRVYTTRYLDSHGSGLGLPLVKTIMELHNGTVEVKSQPARGTTVILRFPPV